MTLQQAREVGVIKVCVCVSLTGIWEICFFMPVCETVLWIRNGAKTGVKP